MPEPYERYVVKKGDTLSGLAGRFLGSPLEWPRIHVLNNRPFAIAMNGRRIKDPDLIYVGQKLLIPRTFEYPQSWHVMPLSPRQAGQPERLGDAVKNIPFPFTGAYHLDDIPLAAFGGPGFEGTVKFWGKVLIMLAHPPSLAEVGNAGLEMVNKSQASRVLTLLLSEAKVTWDEKTNKITYTCNMIANSSFAGGPSTCIGVAVASDKPIPALRGEIRYPKLTGSIHGHQYAALDVKIVIEIQPHAPAGGPLSQPDRAYDNAPATNSAPSLAQRVAKVTLTIVILVAAVVEVSYFFSLRALAAEGATPLPLLFSPGGMRLQTSI
jgi:hypothetical protein